MWNLSKSILLSLRAIPQHMSLPFNPILLSWVNGTIIFVNYVVFGWLILLFNSLHQKKRYICIFPLISIMWLPKRKLYMANSSLQNKFSMAPGIVWIYSNEPKYIKTVDCYCQLTIILTWLVVTSPFYQLALNDLKTP